MTLPIKPPVIVALVAGLIIAAVPAGYFYLQYQSTQKRLQNPNLAAAEESKALVATVGKMMVLPSENPTVATVQDRDKLKDQAFFAKSENGDKVLIFTGAKRVILYRPKTHQIVDVAPINVNQTTTPGAPTPTVGQIKLAIRNGTAITGLTKAYESQLKTKISGFGIVERTNAKRTDYDKSVLIVVNPTVSAQAQTMAKTLGLAVVELPKDEVKPTADILLILGSDAQ